ncbi:MAG: hypothetical protein BWZ10_03178 [candidate division BRC1 bacterium ADurb.BinA364]|nr:MAG: hypothetical protein BWZ10_03178 [candidate division BRC1 bacterium ADurb.BinA364]
MAPAVEKPPMLRAVRGQAEGHAASARFAGHFGDHVAPGAFFRRGPLRKGAIVHREAVVMLGHGHDKSRPGLLEQRRPVRRIELLGLEHRDEILVAELLLRAVGFDMMVEIMPFFVFLVQIHQSRIPFVAKGRHAIGAPMNENAEFVVFIPFGNAIVFERLPRRFEWALSDDRFNGFQAFAMVGHVQKSFRGFGKRNGPKFITR